MKYVDLTFETPEENLAFDEALIDWCEDGYESEILRCWEPKRYFVVLGYSNKIHEEVHLASCRDRHVPVLRRLSGGGTVLQGPGCLNFSLLLKIGRSKELQSITETNRYIMTRHKATVESVLGRSVAIDGSTDLTLESLKFSGNAQRRRKQTLLFHGTFLTQFDLSLMDELLSVPTRQPAYRNQRRHGDFLINLEVPSEALKEALQKTWNATQPLERLPLEKMGPLVGGKYATEAWNFKF